MDQRDYAPVTTSQKDLSAFPSQAPTRHNQHLVTRCSIRRSNTLNRLHKLLALNHLAEDGMLAVKMRGRDRGDEELGSIATKIFPSSAVPASQEIRGRKLIKTYVLGPEFAIDSK